MKTFERRAAQGDLYIERIDGAVPAKAVTVAPEGRHLIVGYSETGHHHVIDAERAVMYRLPEEIYECFIVVSETTALEHLRSFDTHESIELTPGTYRVRRQREYTPEGWRRAQD